MQYAIQFGRMRVQSECKILFSYSPTSCIVQPLLGQVHLQQAALGLLAQHLKVREVVDRIKRVLANRRQLRLGFLNSCRDTQCRK